MAFAQSKEQYELSSAWICGIFVCYEVSHCFWF